MLRAAVLRAAARRAVAQPAAAPRRAQLAAAVACRGATTPLVSRAPGLLLARSYSSGGGLDKEQVEGRIMTLLHGFDKVNNAENIKPNAHFANDMGLDSLDTVEVVMAIEEEFSIEIPDKDADTIHSVDKAVEYILNQPDAS